MASPSLKTRRSRHSGGDSTRGCAGSTPTGYSGAPFLISCGIGPVMRPAISVAVG